MHISFSLISLTHTARLDAIRKAREWVMTISAPHMQHAKVKSVQEILEPRYASQELFGIINPDIRQPLDMMEVLMRIVDDSRISEFKPQYGRGMITAWAHIHGLFLSICMLVAGKKLTLSGRLTGIIANQHPVILPNESDKATHFIGLCNQGQVSPCP
jgi:acetyl-CoA carboxylase carboxyltransferase component